MGLSEQEQARVHLCGLVHDIGKIGLAASVLEKPGALTLDERRMMESHSEIGERILANVADYAESRPSSDTIMSAWTETVILTASQTTVYPCYHGLSQLRTPTTR